MQFERSSRRLDEYAAGGIATAGVPGPAGGRKWKDGGTDKALAGPVWLGWLWLAESVKVTLKNSSKTGFEEAAVSCDNADFGCAPATHTPVGRQRNAKKPLSLERLRGLDVFEILSNRLDGVLGVADGTRTHDDQNHNLGLYQLSYSHR